MTKGSIGHAFTVCIHTENQNQRSFYPFVLHEISVLIELLLGHLCYLLTDVPPQPNSPSDTVSRIDHEHRNRTHLNPEVSCFGVNRCKVLFNVISKLTSRVVVFHLRLLSHLFYASQVSSQGQTRVKLNRVFFPRCCAQARSLGCGFAG